MFGRTAKYSEDKGTTTVKKDHQTTTTAAEFAVPDTVSLAMTNLADELHEGLLAVVVGTGLQVMDAILEESLTLFYWPKGPHDPSVSPCATATRTARSPSEGARSRCAVH